MNILFLWTLLVISEYSGALTVVDNPGETTKITVDTGNGPVSLIVSKRKGRSMKFKAKKTPNFRNMGVPKPFEVTSKLVGVKSSKDEIASHVIDSSGRGSRGPQKTTRDKDGVLVIHGVREPDDPNDTRVFRNARVINNVLVGDKQEKENEIFSTKENNFATKENSFARKGNNFATKENKFAKKENDFFATTKRNALYLLSRLFSRRRGRTLSHVDDHKNEENQGRSYNKQFVAYGPDDIDRKGTFLNDDEPNIATMNETQRESSVSDGEDLSGLKRQEKILNEVETHSKSDAKHIVYATDLSKNGQVISISPVNGIPTRVTPSQKLRASYQNLKSLSEEVGATQSQVQDTENSDLYDIDILYENEPLYFQYVDYVDDSVLTSENPISNLANSSADSASQSYNLGISNWENLNSNWESLNTNLKTPSTDLRSQSSAQEVGTIYEPQSQVQNRENPQIYNFLYADDPLYYQQYVDHKIESIPNSETVISNLANPSADSVSRISNFEKLNSLKSSNLNFKKSNTDLRSQSSVNSNSISNLIQNSRPIFQSQNGGHLEENFSSGASHKLHQNQTHFEKLNQKTAQPNYKVAPPYYAQSLQYFSPRPTYSANTLQKPSKYFQKPSGSIPHGFEKYSATNFQWSTQIPYNYTYKNPSWITRRHKPSNPLQNTNYSIPKMNPPPLPLQNNLIRRFSVVDGVPRVPGVPASHQQAFVNTVGGNVDLLPVNPQNFVIEHATFQAKPGAPVFSVPVPRPSNHPSSKNKAGNFHNGQGVRYHDPNHPNQVFSNHANPAFSNQLVPQITNYQSSYQEYEHSYPFFKDNSLIQDTRPFFVRLMEPFRKVGQRVRETGLKKPVIFFGESKRKYSNKFNLKKIAYISAGQKVGNRLRINERVDKLSEGTVDADTVPLVGGAIAIATMGALGAYAAAKYSSLKDLKKILPSTSRSDGKNVSEILQKLADDLESDCDFLAESIQSLTWLESECAKRMFCSLVTSSIQEEEMKIMVDIAGNSIAINPKSGTINRKRGDSNRESAGVKKTNSFSEKNDSISEIPKDDYIDLAEIREKNIKSIRLNAKYFGNIEHSANTMQGRSANTTQGRSGNATHGKSANTTQGRSGNATHIKSANTTQEKSGNATHIKSANTTQGKSGNATHRKSRKLAVRQARKFRDSETKFFEDQINLLLNNMASDSTEKAKNIRNQARGVVEAVKNNQCHVFYCHGV